MIDKVFFVFTVPSNPMTQSLTGLPRKPQVSDGMKLGPKWGGGTIKTGWPRGKGNCLDYDGPSNPPLAPTPLLLIHLHDTHPPKQDIENFPVI